MKESFSLPESKAVWKHLETVAMRSHHNTRRAFEDFIGMAVCTLAGGAMESEYLEIAKHYHGQQAQNGGRAIDAFPFAFGALIEGMETTGQDILGDLFQGGVTGGENGQFFTPEAICNLMAQMQIEPDMLGKKIHDPACGSGRTLLAAAKIARHNEFSGCDVDIRCVHMTALNLALRGLRGFVVWGNSLTLETQRVYRIGFNGAGFISRIDAQPEVEHGPEAETTRQSQEKTVVFQKAFSFTEAV